MCSGTLEYYIFCLGIWAGEIRRSLEPSADNTSIRGTLLDSHLLCPRESSGNLLSREEPETLTCGDMLQLIFASRILLLVTLALSKCCVLFFIRQLFAEYRKNTRLVCNILIGLMLAWGTGSALAVSLDCAAANTILEYAKQNCPNEVRILPFAFRRLTFDRVHLKHFTKHQDLLI